jgi:hypothetical protein
MVERQKKDTPYIWGYVFSHSEIYKKRKNGPNLCGSIPNLSTGPGGQSEQPIPLYLEDPTGSKPYIWRKGQFFVIFSTYPQPLLHTTNPLTYKRLGILLLDSTLPINYNLLIIVNFCPAGMVIDIPTY